jgi:hypothetical protein
MNKTIDPKLIAELSRYTPEELDPHTAQDEAAMDAFIERNRDALNKALEAGYVSLKNGEGIPIRSLEDLLAALDGDHRHVAR